jgi:ribosomal protein S18 acetylase RimI-like enzyme
MIPISIREFHYPDDYTRALELWNTSGEGVRVGASDAPTEIEKKLERDPDLFLVAEAGGELVGTVIGGFDGRRGHVYHLAVAEGFRRQGVGSRLMKELETRLIRKGCIRCYLIVRAGNDGAMRHYEALGWHHLDDDHLYAKDLL